MDKGYSQDTKVGRLSFKRKLRAEMLDSNERQIERLKSYNKGLKQQIRELSYQIAEEYAKRG